MRIAEQCFGSGSELDPDSIGSADPDPGRPRFSLKKGKKKKNSCLKVVTNEKGGAVGDVLTIIC